MKKILLFTTVTCLLLTSCAKNTTSTYPKEKVKYKKINYKIENKDLLTQKEVRQDCDWLKYLFYNVYAGADEAISLGFDLDACIEEIYTQTIAKELSPGGPIQNADFRSIVLKTFSEQLTNTDMHIQVASGLHNALCLYHSTIFIEKIDSGDNSAPTSTTSNTSNTSSASPAAPKYVVKFSEAADVKTGDVYTGPETNLYKYTKDGIELYRYSIMSKQYISKAVISINGQNIKIPVETEDTIPSKDSWTGLKTTKNTLYMSLGNCTLAYGLTDANNKFNLVWKNFISDISKNAKGKQNIIFDMRSNGGGYLQFPADMLAAAYYFNNTQEEYQKDLSSAFMNMAQENECFLISPVTMQNFKNFYTKYCKQEFERFLPETQAYYKKYWRQMKINPYRQLYPEEQYQTQFSELPTPDFTGNVYVLINRHSGSAAEYGTQMAYCLKEKGINVTLVGENSWGGVKYGGMNANYLPHSGIYLSLGTSFGESPLLQSLPSWKGEGLGFYPDYWATNDLILQTLVQLTGDEELTQALEGLDKQQL